jgi:hypothetical protein
VKEVQDEEITGVIDVGYDRVTDSRKRRKHWVLHLDIGKLHDNSSVDLFSTSIWLVPT